MVAKVVRQVATLPLYVLSTPHRLDLGRMRERKLSPVQGTHGRDADEVEFAQVDTGDVAQKELTARKVVKP